MLVQFSAWETARTSLRLTASKRKRRRGGSTSSVGDVEGSTDTDLLLAGSIVTNRASRRKKRGGTDTTRALFALTSGHRVAILVEKNKGFSPGATTSESLDAAGYMHESSKLQYSTRPGDATSFLTSSASSNTNGAKKGSMALKPPSPIPVIFDARNERVFAIQGGNMRLVTWDANVGGPDKLEPQCVYNLPERATSLSILQSGLVIGSCESGRLFYASVAGKTKLEVTMLGDGKEKPVDGYHAGTLISVVAEEPINVTPPASQKAKQKVIQGSEHLTKITVFQMFLKGCTLTVRRSELAGSESAIVGQKKCTEATMSLFPEDMKAGASPAVEDAVILPTTIASIETATMAFRHRDTPSSGSRLYCCTIQLKSATLARPPFVIPCSPQRVALVSPRVLVLGTDDELLVCDSFDGVILHAEPLPPVLKKMEDGQDWLLLSDSSRCQLLVLCSDKNERLHITSSKLNLKNDGAAKDLQKASDINLAARLSAAMGEFSQDLTMAQEPKELALLKSKRASKSAKFDQAIDRAVDCVRNSEALIGSTKGVGYKNGSFLNDFDEAVGDLEDSLKTMDKPKVVLMNGGASTPMKNGKKSRHEAKNGLKKRRSVHFKFSVTLPLTFVDGVMPTILRLVSRASSFTNLPSNVAFSIRQDCSIILGRLLKTGDVSARRHFDHNMVTEDGFMKVLCCMGAGIDQTVANRLRSPVDCIHDMLRYCPDVSESQMVTMVHFMICSANPADIAFFLLDAAKQQGRRHHPHKDLCRRMFAKESFAITREVVIAGCTGVLEKILLYSHCNQTLLCSAFRKHLVFGEETGLMSSILSDIAFSRTSLTASCLSTPLKSSKCLTASASQWIPALFDAFEEELEAQKNELGPGEQTDLEKLHSGLRRGKRQTEALFNLEDKLNDAIIAVTFEAEKRKITKEEKRRERAAKRRKLREEEDELPRFFVEHFNPY